METTICRAELTVKNLDSAEFRGAVLESYATDVRSDKKLVAIMNQGVVVSDANVDAKNVDYIYVD